MLNSFEYVRKKDGPQPKTRNLKAHALLHLPDSESLGVFSAANDGSFSIFPSMTVHGRDAGE